MKKVYFVVPIFGLLFLCIIPIGRCDSYLSTGQFVEKSVSVKVGDTLRCDYRTYNSPFKVGAGYEYDGQAYSVSTTYTQGWFEVYVDSAGIINVALVNVDLNSGNIEYSIGVKGAGGDDSIPIGLLPIFLFTILSTLGIITLTHRKIKF